MSKDDHAQLASGMMDLSQITGQELLDHVANMFYLAPPDSEPFIDIMFKDSWGEERAMRMYLYGGSREKHNIH
jgi:hypothetical protein